MNPEPGSPIQILTAVTDRHLIPVVDIDRPGLKHLYIAAQASIQTLAGDGAPADYAAAVAATLTLVSIADNSDLTFTAVVPGAAGNAYTVTISQPTEPDEELFITLLDDFDAVISLPTDEEGDPVAVIASAVKTAWDLAGLNAVITIAFDGTGAGAVDAAAEDNLADGADEVLGTGYGTAGPGSTYIDYSTPTIYVNTGTAEEPVWEAA